MFNKKINRRMAFLLMVSLFGFFNITQNCFGLEKDLNIDKSVKGVLDKFSCYLNSVSSDFQKLSKKVKNGVIDLNLSILVQARLDIDVDCFDNTLEKVLIEKCSKTDLDIFQGWIFGSDLITNYEVELVSRILKEAGISSDLRSGRDGVLQMLLNLYKDLYREGESKFPGDIVTIKFGNNLKIKAHKVVLMARSDWFRRHLFKYKCDSVNLDFIDEKTGKALIKFIYTDKLDKLIIASNYDSKILGLGDNILLGKKYLTELNNLQRAANALEFNEYSKLYSDIKCAMPAKDLIIKASMPYKKKKKKDKKVFFESLSESESEDNSESGDEVVYIDMDKDFKF